MLERNFNYETAVNKDLEKTRLEEEHKRKEADRLKDEAEYNRLKKKRGK